MDSVTMFDVAERAGVSHQTVSRVINGHPNVKASTRLRVEDAIDHLGYRPNALARSLVTKRSKTIGLIATGIPDYGPSSTMLGINQAALAAGYRVSIATLAHDDRASLLDTIDTLLDQHVEAIVLIAAKRSGLSAIEGFTTSIPFIIAESSGAAGTFRAVSIDQERGAELATQHLIDLGHRTILHISGPMDSMDALQRIKGWRKALSRAGLFAIEPHEGTWSPESGYRIGQRLLQMGEFSAVFCGNDQMGLGLMRAITEAGKSVPGDISIVGFDDIPEAAFFRPGLTTVRQDFDTLGRTIISVLLGEISAPSTSGPTLLPPSLVIRGSTGKAT